MTIEEIRAGLARLQASYPNMSKLDELTITAYLSELMPLKYEDFFVACREVVRTSKFFPTIAELVEASENAQRKRLEQQDREEREERLALQAGEDRIMDPKSSVHRVVVGPNHQKFLDMLSGKIQLPEPEWARKGRGQVSKGEAA